MVTVSDAMLGYKRFALDGELLDTEPFQSFPDLEIHNARPLRHGVTLGISNPIIQYQGDRDGSLWIGGRLGLMRPPPRSDTRAWYAFEPDLDGPWQITLPANFR